MKCASIVLLAGIGLGSALPSIAPAQGFVVHTTYPGTSIPLPSGRWDMNIHWESIINGDRVVSQSHTRLLQAPQMWSIWGGMQILDNGIVLGFGGDGVTGEYFAWDLNGVPHSLGFGEYGFSDQSYTAKRFLDSGGILYTMLNSNMQAFDTILRADGSFTVLPPSHTGSRWFALDMNSSGTMAGWHFISSSTGQGIRQYADGSYETLPHEYVPTRINERGDIGGYIEEPGLERHFLWLADGQLRVFESMGAVDGSFRLDIPVVLPNGDLVSRVNLEDLTPNYWVGKADGSRVWVKDYLGAPTSRQYASLTKVRSNGYVLGSYYNTWGRDSVPFVAVPVPEPTTLLALVLPVAAFLRRRRN